MRIWPPFRRDKVADPLKGDFLGQSVITLSLQVALSEITRKWSENCFHIQIIGKYLITIRPKLSAGRIRATFGSATTFSSQAGNPLARYLFRICWMRNTLSYVPSSDSANSRRDEMRTQRASDVDSASWRSFRFSSSFNVPLTLSNCEMTKPRENVAMGGVVTKWSTTISGSPSLRMNELVNYTIVPARQ